jgi:hypothetical protein
VAENTLQDLVRRVRAVPEFKALFTNLWGDDDVLRRFFFAHRDLLFPRIEEQDFHVTIPLLFFGTEPSEPEEQVLITAGESRKAQLDLLGETTGRKVEEISHDAKIAACLLVLRFVARNPALKSLLDQGEPSWAAIAMAIAATPPVLDIFEEFKPGQHRLAPTRSSTRSLVGTQRGSRMWFGRATSSNMLPRSTCRIT